MTCLVERYVRAIVAYDGTDFCGFQIQGGHQAHQSDRNAEPAPRTDVLCPRTVQGVLEESLAQITRERIRLVGAGRTDAGVHALGQVVAFTTHWRHTLPDLWRAWNAVLQSHQYGRDVAILNLGQARRGFHPRFDATSRVYRYTIFNHPMRNPLLRRTALWVPQSLDVASMGAALEVLVGEHDFATFGTAPGGRRRERHAGKRSTVRRVLRATVREGLLTATATGRSQPVMIRAGTVDADRLGSGADRRPPTADRLVSDLGRIGSADHPENGCCCRAVYVDIEANAFLYRMVRSIVGTILQVGRGQLSVAQFASLFAAADRGQAGPTAPPHGLCLVAVHYSNPAASSRPKPLPATGRHRNGRRCIIGVEAGQ